MGEPCIVKYRVGNRIYTKKIPFENTLHDFVLTDWQRAERWISGTPGAVLLVAGQFVCGVKQLSLFSPQPRPDLE